MLAIVERISQVELGVFFPMMTSTIQRRDTAWSVIGSQLTELLNISKKYIRSHNTFASSLY